MKNVSSPSKKQSKEPGSIPPAMNREQVPPLNAAEAGGIENPIIKIAVIPSIPNPYLMPNASHKGRDFM